MNPWIVGIIRVYSGELNDWRIFLNSSKGFDLISSGTSCQIFRPQ